MDEERGYREEEEREGSNEEVEEDKEIRDNRVDNVNNANDVNEVIDNDRVDTRSNGYSRGEGEKEDIQNIEKAKQEDRESIQRDVEDLINKLKESKELASIIPNWSAWLSSLGDVKNWFLTKEDYMLIRSYLTLLDANTFANILEEIRNRSNDQCEIDKLIQFIVIKKIGSALLQSAKNRIDSITKSIEIQSNMYVKALEQIGAIANSMANAHKLLVGVPNSEIPNIAINIKLASLITTVITAITAIGIEIGNLKNNLREILNNNEFCIRGCRSGCESSVILTTTNIKKVSSEEIYNEGVEFAKESNKTLSILEEFMELELEYMKKKLEEDFERKKVNIKKKVDNIT